MTSYYSDNVTSFIVVLLQENELTCVYFFIAFNSTRTTPQTHLFDQLETVYVETPASIFALRMRSPFSMARSYQSNQSGSRSDYNADCGVFAIKKNPISKM